MPTDQRMKFTSGHVPTCRPSVFRLIVLGHLPLSHFCTFQEFPRRNDFNLHQQIPPLLRNNSSNRFHILRRYSWVYSRTVTSVSSACCSSFETGSLRGSELPRQPLAQLVLGDALERLRLPDGVVELVQQLRLLELIRLVCGGGGLVHGLHERLVGLPGLFDRRVVSGRFVVRPVGVAAADARQRHGHRRDDDGSEVGGLNTLGLALLWSGVIHGFHSL